MDDSQYPTTPLATAASRELGPDVRLYHYTGEPFVFDPARVYATDADLHFKPRGLWVSAEKAADEDHDYRGWKEWCEAETFGLDRLGHRAEVVLHPTANVRVISDEPALRRFHREFHNGGRRLDGLDWHRVMARFDGLIIAPMIWSCRLELLWYYGWDCSSGCIWKLSAVAGVTAAGTRIDADYAEIQPSPVL